jgi:hypothetical protein
MKIPELSDRRSSDLAKRPDHWVWGAEPITRTQMSHSAPFSEKAGYELPKGECSKPAASLIENLKHEREQK